MKGELEGPLHPDTGAQGADGASPGLGSWGSFPASCGLDPAKVCDLILKALLEMGGVFRL